VRFILVLAVCFALADFVLVGFGGAFALLVLIRASILVGSLLTIRLLRRIRHPADLDRLLLVWTMAGIFSVFLMNTIRPPGHTPQLAIQALTLLAVYLVIPNRLSTRLIMAGFVTVMTTVMHLAGLRQADPFTAVLVWATVMMTNLMGVAISARFYTLRREQFRGRVELERVRDDLQIIATTDALTGLLSRRRFLELAERDLARARRYGRRLSLLAIDLDHFKQVNDRYGHAAGDAVLIAVAQALIEQTREHDLVGRLGGEELALVLPETGLEAAQQLAQRIRAHIRSLMPESDGVRIPITVSLGVAEARPDDLSVQALLKRADRALYQAKEYGRDRVVAA
jgi:diguanylate cyclase (GGDEF)-like protein